METLKAQLTRIQEQLAGLTATQKMLTASLVAIMVMTLVWWSHYAADPEMVSLLGESSLSTDDVGQISGHLDEKGINYKVEGDKIMVPADRRLGIIAELTYTHAMPSSSKTPFDEIIKEINPWQSPEMTDQMLLHAKQQTLAMIISNFPGAASAWVVIDPTTERRFDSTSIQPSATVTITTRDDGKASAKQLANAAADVVAGAEAGLTRGRISVVVDGHPITIRDKDADGGMGVGDDSFVEMLRHDETAYSDKIRELFGDINGLMVSVSCKVNTSFEESTSHTIVDPKVTIHQETEINEKTDDSAGGSSGGEPGAAPNTGLDVSGGGSGGATSNSTDNSTKFENDHNFKNSTTRQGPGEATAVAASVRVPRSYFVQAFKNKNGGKEPDDAGLAAFTADELAQIKKDVKACTYIASDDAVVVGLYNDPTPVEATTPLETASSPVTMMVGSHTKEIGVGVLAAMSLFMVSMMVKKGTPAPVLATPIEMPEPSKLHGGEELAGEVHEGGAVMEGMELDEGSVKTQQVVTQVQQMVAENPEAAANLVKRWLSHS